MSAKPAKQAGSSIASVLSSVLCSVAGKALCAVDSEPQLLGQHAFGRVLGKVKTVEAPAVHDTKAKLHNV